MAQHADKPISKFTRRQLCCFSVLVAATVASGIAVVLLGAAYRPVQGLVKSLIASQVVLTNGSVAFKSWSGKSNIPVYNVYYFFNITNADEFLSSGGKIPLNVSELGPFYYRENKTKVNCSWSDNEDTVSYDQVTRYTFDPERSVGDPTQLRVTTVNIPLMGLVIQLYNLAEQYGSDFIKEALVEIEKALYQLFKDDDPLFINNRTVHEILWGYNDTLLSYLASIPIINEFVPSGFVTLQNMTSITSNNTVKTGKLNSTEVGQYIMWGNVTKIGGWNTTTAQMINGTDGLLFHPDVKDTEDLYVFIDEIYRSGYLIFNGTNSIHGIKYYKYIIPTDELKNTTQDPGFYPEGVPSGVLNMTSVATTLEIPLYSSKPHFLDADPVYLSQVTGMKPNRTLHDSIIGVEPLTGAVILARKRLQLNIWVKSYSDFVPYYDFPYPVMVPIFWANEEGDITQPLSNEFKMSVYAAKYGFTSAVLFLIGVAGLTGLVCVMCAVAVVARKRFGTNRQPINYSERTPILTANLEHTPEL